MMPDARDIARMVTMRQLLSLVGWRVRHRDRADCGLCRGGSIGTVSYKERLWHCHRCGAGGDLFSLVRAVNRCDFPEALRVVAHLAGIRIEDSRGSDVRHDVASRKQRRERLESAADKLEALERELRLECRARIHDTERQQLKASARLAAIQQGEPERFRGEQEALWLTLRAAAVLLNSDLPAYTLLSFGPPDERARFVLHAELREEIISGVRWAGYLQTADGKQIEVLA
jgi:hypothetical protein